MNTSLSPWPQLRQAADKARLASLHDQAINLYTQALEQPAVPWETVAAITLARAESRSKLGHFSTLDAELSHLAQHARTQSDPAVAAEALALLAAGLRPAGNLQRCRTLAEEAVLAASTAQQPRLAVLAQAVLGLIQLEQGDGAAARRCLAQAQARLAGDDLPGLLRTMNLQGIIALRSGDHPQAVQCGERALHLAVAAGSRTWEASSLKLLAIATADFARRRSLLDQALAVYEEDGDRVGEAQMLTNLALWCGDAGLYAQAIQYDEQALRISREIGMALQIAYILDGLGLFLMEAGDLDRAAAVMAETLALAHKMGQQRLATNQTLNLAQVELHRDRPQAALDRLAALEHIWPSRPPFFTAYCLALQAAAHRRLGAGELARQLALHAAALLDPADLGSPEQSAEEVLVWCYAALAPEPPAGEGAGEAAGKAAGKAAGEAAGKAAGEGAAAALPPECWQILELARQASTAPIAQLADAGLRRGFLHRVRCRRILWCAWLAWAPHHLPAAAIEAQQAQVLRPGRLDEMLIRLAAGSTLFPNRHDSAVLPGDILHLAAELTGAQRLALALCAPDGSRRLAATLLPPPLPPSFAGLARVSGVQDAAAFEREIEPWLEEAAGSRQARIWQIASTAAAAQGGPASVLAAPLINHGRLLGILYADLAGSFGQFDQDDLRLFKLLAGQAAAAWESAEWAATLEQRVAERTAEAETARVRAEESARAESRFLANMSHELRTPLNTIVGMAQVMEDDPDLTPAQEANLQAIVQSSEHLLTLINEVLDLAKIGAGKMELFNAPFDLHAVLRALQAMLQPRADAKGLHLIFEVAPDLPRYVLGDGGKLRQVLLNLLSNALKFTAAGSVTLRAGYGADERAVFCVEDTGPGIAADEIPFLFDEFSQTEAGRHTQQGTGLGLPISYKFVQLMGGSLDVSSQWQSGSTFCARLPLPPAADQANEAPPAVAGLAADSPGARILIVDDVAANRQVLEQILRPLALDISSVDSGASALTLWERWNPDLIWLDIRMEGMDGLEVARTIRRREAEEGRQRTHLVAITASMLTEDRDVIAAAGCDDLVPKPFRRQMIFDILAQRLGLRYRYRSPVSPARAGARAGAEAGAEAGAVAGGEHPSVLLVDDDPVGRKLAARLLEKLGYSADLAADGAEALARLRERGYSLVFLDLHMPVLSGEETAQRIRQEWGEAGPVLIALTGSTGDELSREGQALFNGWLLKPLRPADLQPVLDRWL